VKRDHRKNGSTGREGHRPEVHAVPVPESAPSAAEFREGDVVALTGKALRMGRLSMSPMLLYSIGFANEFIVTHTFETKKDGRCISLYPCCNNRFNRKTGKPFCTGHSEIFFERVDLMRMPQKGDRQASIKLPMLGEIAGMEYEDDEHNPKLTTRVAGLSLVLGGQLAKLVKESAEKLGYI
jgi:hypothetical protein